MKMQIGSVQKCLYLFKISSFFMLVFATSISSKSNKCPFNYLFHFGDGFSDIGNSIRVLPSGSSLASTRLPYGETFPGEPTGRWSDGRINSDLIARDLGLPNITPYLSMNKSRNVDGVIFSVAQSPVLDRDFFKSRGIDVPPYVVALKDQLIWFKTYLKSACSNQTDCSNILGNSVIVFGDEEGNDIGYALSQGKSIEEAKTYVPLIINQTIQSAREMIKMGATRVVIPGNGPLGCNPYILSTFSGNSSFGAYDNLGCLKSVNDLILSKNKDLAKAIKDLSKEFPRTTIYYAEIYALVKIIISETKLSGIDPLKTCCGIGGKYNFDPKRLCGSRGVPSCSDPGKYIYWDGIHLTQGAYSRLEQFIAPIFLPLLGCRLL